MRFIHTSDWHLGKTLEGNSRLEEQEMFLNDFVDIVEQNDIDMVIIAGDIYDTSNPPAAAEKLFYKTICKLADDGNRCVVIISGNHDNPERLSAITPLAEEMGILVFGYPLSKTTEVKYKGFEITQALEGCTKLNINGKTYVVEDRGGAVKGNKIDVYMNSHAAALAWGVKYLPVEIVD